jgi:hypothetical protein
MRNVTVCYAGQSKISNDINNKKPISPGFLLVTLMKLLHERLYLFNHYLNKHVILRLLHTL